MRFILRGYFLYHSSPYKILFFNLDKPIQKQLLIFGLVAAFLI
jgi:hypothetical protein